MVEPKMMNMAMTVATTAVTSPHIPRVVKYDISSIVLTAMSALGVAAVTLYWLTFFPTRGYLSWVEARYARVAPQASS